MVEDQVVSSGDQSYHGLRQSAVSPVKSCWLHAYLCSQCGSLLMPEGCFA